MIEKTYIRMWQFQIARDKKDEFDTFRSKVAFEIFLREFKSEYDELDYRCEGLTLSEKSIGEFENLTM